MGTKAFLQKGRGKPGLILPANAVAKINESKDRSALVRAAERTAAQEGTAPNVSREDMRHPAPKPDLEPAPDPATPDNLLCAEVKPVPIATTAAATVEVTAPVELAPTVEVASTEPDDLTRIAGIGPALNQRLQKFGFKNYGDLANASAATLDEIQGVKGRGASIIESARKLAGA